MSSNKDDDDDEEEEERLELGLLTSSESNGYKDGSCESTLVVVYQIELMDFFQTCPDFCKRFQFPFISSAVTHSRPYEPDPALFNFSDLTRTGQSC